jgi:hypothetical protein
MCIAIANAMRWRSRESDLLCPPPPIAYSFLLHCIMQQNSQITSIVRCRITVTLRPEYINLPIHKYCESWEVNREGKVSTASAVVSFLNNDWFVVGDSPSLRIHIAVGSCDKPGTVSVTVQVVIKASPATADVGPLITILNCFPETGDNNYMLRSTYILLYTGIFKLGG